MTLQYSVRKILHVDMPVYFGSTPEVDGLTIVPAGASSERAYFWGIYPQRLFVTLYTGVTQLEVGRYYNVLYGYSRDEDAGGLPSWATGANRKFNKLTILEEIPDYLDQDYPSIIKTSLSSYLAQSLMANDARQGFTVRDGDTMTIRNAGGAPFLAGTVIVDGSSIVLEAAVSEVTLQFPIEVINE